MTTHFGYGHFPGGDPRDFTPDPECSTDEERAKHREACERWDRGDTAPKAAYEEGPHVHFASADGKMVGHVTLCGFGLGTYAYADDGSDVEYDDEDGDWDANVRAEEPS